MNLNPALGTSFLLEIPLLKEVNYFCQTAELPGITMAGIDSPYQNQQGALPSNRLDFDPLNLTFLVDEGYDNWFSLVEWFYLCRRGKGDIAETMQDVTLHLVNSNKNLNRQILFRGAFPTMVGSIPLESSTVDAQPLVCSVSFRYQFFEMIKAT